MNEEYRIDPYLLSRPKHNSSNCNYAYVITISDFWFLMVSIKGSRDALEKYRPYYIEATVNDVGNCITWINKNTELILGLHPANERRRFKVTPSLIGWVQA